MNLPHYPSPSPDSEPSDAADDLPTTRARIMLMLGAVVPVALVATVLAGAIGRLDTALFFVGVPALLAFVVGLAPVRDSSGQLFQAVTVALLLVSAFLHEGALCVLIVSPLVYGVAFAIHGIVRLARRRRTRWSLAGVLVVLALEGAVPGLRVSPVHDVSADRVVAADCGDFAAALQRGPRIDAQDDRGWLLQLAQYPTPTSATGDGLAVGDTWSLAMPAGGIETVVSDRETTERGGRLAFDVTADDARTTRWVTLREGTLTWEQTDEGCVAEMEVVYERDLDPAFWFGPVSELFMGAGTAAFLASLD